MFLLLKNTCITLTNIFDFQFPPDEPFHGIKVVQNCLNIYFHSCSKGIFHFCYTQCGCIRENEIQKLFYYFVHNFIVEKFRGPSQESAICTNLSSSEYKELYSSKIANYSIQSLRFDIFVFLLNFAILNTHICPLGPLQSSEMF